MVYCSPVGFVMHEIIHLGLYIVLYKVSVVLFSFEIFTKMSSVFMNLQIICYHCKIS